MGDKKILLNTVKRNRNELSNTLAIVSCEEGKVNNLEQRLIFPLYNDKCEQRLNFPLYNNKCIILPSQIKETEFKLEYTTSPVFEDYGKRALGYTDKYTVSCYPLLSKIQVKLPEIIYGKILSYEEREFPLFEEEETTLSELCIDTEFALGLKSRKIDPVMYVLTKDNKVQECVFGANYANLFFRGRESLKKLEENGKELARREPQSFLKRKNIKGIVVGISYTPTPENPPKEPLFKFNLSYVGGRYKERSKEELKAFLDAYLKLGSALIFTGERRDNVFIVDSISDGDQNNFFNAYMLDY